MRYHHYHHYEGSYILEYQICALHMRMTREHLVEKQLGTSNVLEIPRACTTQQFYQDCCCLFLCHTPIVSYVTVRYRYECIPIIQ